MAERHIIITLLLPCRHARLRILLDMLCLSKLKRDKLQTPAVPMAAALIKSCYIMYHCGTMRRLNMYS